MKNFTLLDNFSQLNNFGDCNNCQAKCCSGIFGTIFSQILADEFESIYKNFPILFIFGDLNFIKPVVLLTNGFDFCPYLKDFKCQIYSNRPNVCKNYPLSPNLDNKIYIDLSCPQLNKGKNSIKVDEENFLNYQEKYIKTHFEFEKLKTEDFEKVTTIRNIDFFKYIGDEESKYLTLHKLSLKNLKNLSI